jgi:hypothetical protein
LLWILQQMFCQQGKFLNKKHLLNQWVHSKLHLEYPTCLQDSQYKKMIQLSNISHLDKHLSNLLLACQKLHHMNQQGTSYKTKIQQ